MCTCGYVCACIDVVCVCWVGLYMFVYVVFSPIWSLTNRPRSIQLQPACPPGEMVHGSGEDEHAHLPTCTSPPCLPSHMHTSHMHTSSHAHLLTCTPTHPYMHTPSHAQTHTSTHPHMHTSSHVMPVARGGFGEFDRTPLRRSRYAYAEVWYRSRPLSEAIRGLLTRIIFIHVSQCCS